MIRLSYILFCLVLISQALSAEGTVQSPNSDSKHWAFEPVRCPQVPAVRDASWPRTPIDRFILAKLEANGLAPAPPADRLTLLRRVTFDLIGLPPAPEEIEAFVSDASSDAFDKVIERLLASPHYGERWGRHWLDVARFADTKGYVFFEDKEYPWAYTYRDYVIRAFNDDLPYDRFILQQLAADLLVGQVSNLSNSAGQDEKLSYDRSALPALGFLTLGGRFMNNTHDILDDRIDVVTRGLMGLTVTCTRCHDHKYDPISMKDYYGLYGVFANTVEPTVPPLFFRPERTPQYEAFEKELRQRERRYAGFVEARHEEVTRQAMTRMTEYLLAAHDLRDKPRSDDFMILADPGDLNPTMTLRWKAYLDRTRKSREPIFVLWHVLAELPEREFVEKAPAALAAVAERAHPLVLRALSDPAPKSLAEAAGRYSALLNKPETEARLRVAIPAFLRGLGLQPPEPPPPSPDPARELSCAVFQGPDCPPNWPLHTIDDLALFPDRAGQAKLQELRKAVEEWRIKGPGAPPRAMTLEDAATIRETRVFVRGNPNNLGEPAPRKFLSVLAGENRQPFQQGSGRLELARAIANPENPLTARVMVNRIWLHHFGQGLVRTPGDFGLRGEPPTHPELLDWLAAELVASGWWVKHMHRLILRSAVFQQSATGDSRAADPDNRLLSRMNRRRLAFETTRDALLTVSGRLDRTVGGPSLRDLLGPKANRRTMYAHLDRLNVPGLYRTFDYPSPDATSSQRDVTTVAPQALFLMNNPFVLDCAKQLLQRKEIAGEGDLAKRVERIYRHLYGRSPTTTELSLAREFLRSPDTSATWERYVQALLIANEFVFVD
jgi:hypothetical protein